MKSKINLIMVFLYFVYTQISISNELNINNKELIKQNYYNNTYYSLSNNNMYMMIADNILMYDKYKISIIDITTFDTLLTRAYFCKNDSGIVPIKIFNDGKTLLCHSNNRLFTFDLEKNLLFDSLDVCLPNIQRINSLPDNLVAGYLISNGMVDSSQFVVKDILLSSYLYTFSLSSPKRILKDFTISENGEYCAIKYIENNNIKFLLKSFKNGSEKEINDIYDNKGICISPNSKYFVYSTFSSLKPLILDLQTNTTKEMQLSVEDNIYIGKNSISTDSKSIFVCQDSIIHLIDLETGNLIKTLNIFGKDIAINSIDNDRILCSSNDNSTFTIIDINNNQQIRNYLNYNDNFQNNIMIPSKFNDHILISSFDASLGYDVKSDSVIFYYNHNSKCFGGISDLLFDFDNDNCYYYNDDNRLNFVDIPTKNIINQIDNTIKLTSFCLLPDTNLIALSDSLKLQIINKETKSVVYTYLSVYQAQTLKNIRVSDDKKYLYVGSDPSDYNVEDIVIKFDLQNLSNYPTYYYYNVTGPNKYFSSDNKYLMNNRSNREIYNTETKLTESLEWFSSYEGEPEPNSFTDCGFSYDGKYIFATVNNYLYVWDYKTKKLIKTYRDQAEFNTMRISNVSKTLFVYKSDYTFEVLKYEDELGVFDIKSSESGLKSYLLNNNSSLSIANDKLNPELCTYELYNASGELIIQNYICSITDKNIEFKSMGLIPGAYFLNIRDKAQTKIYKIMIIGE